MRFLSFLLPLMLAVPSALSAAQPTLRALEVPATASWQHAATGLILPPTIGAMKRGSIQDYGTQEMDVVAAYEDPADALIVTVYLFKTMLPETPIWFDRALTVIETRPEYGVDGRTNPTITSFARPGASVAAGLRTALDLPRPHKSSALAVVPLGNGWLMKFRLSSSRLDTAELDRRMTELIQGVRWPAADKPMPAASPIADCEKPLKLKKAKVIRPTLQQTLMNSFLSAVPFSDAKETKETKAATVYCREPGPRAEFSVYRPVGSRDNYVIAIYDAGFGLQLMPTTDLMSLGKRDSASTLVSMSSLGRDSIGSLLSFDRLPPPEQALTVARVPVQSASISVTQKKD